MNSSCSIKDMDDVQLVELAKNGESRAYDELVKRHSCTPSSIR